MGFWIRAKPDFSKHIVLRVFEKWDPDISPKSQIFKISCSSHSENAHIKLNLDFWCRAERCGPPFIFFMGWMLRFGRNGPSRAVYPPWWGNRYFFVCSIFLGGPMASIYPFGAAIVTKYSAVPFTTCKAMNNTCCDWTWCGCMCSPFHDADANSSSFKQSYAFLPIAPPRWINSSGGSISAESQHPAHKKNKWRSASFGSASKV